LVLVGGTSAFMLIEGLSPSEIRALHMTVEAIQHGLRGWCGINRGGRSPPGSGHHGLHQQLGAGGGRRGPNQGRISADLVPGAPSGTRSVDQIIADLRPGRACRRPRLHGQFAADQSWRQ
jgi:hypothetical protein